MRPRIAGTVALLAAVSGTMGCVDLDVRNPNAPELDRLDIESLLGGAFWSWLGADYGVYALAPPSAISFQHSTPWATFGMLEHSQIPRVPVENSAEVSVRWWFPMAAAWTLRYAAIASARGGLLKLDEGTAALGEAEQRMARAYAKFVLGLAHGSMALMFDSAYVYDETMEPDEPVLQPYGPVMEAALEYLGEAATLAESGTFTVPAAWMSREVTAAELARLAYSWRARFRANVARTPAERAAVDWVAVVDDANRGITADWAIQCDGTDYGYGASWADQTIYYTHHPVWGMAANWVLGMADTSGRYQEWLAMPTLEKRPLVTDALGNIEFQFLYLTPDTRLPQGASLAEQVATRGAYYEVAEDPLWRQPLRGTWRWSYYRDHRWDGWLDANGGPAPFVTVREMRLLVAEAAYRSGDPATAASIVNETRMLYGLNPTDAQGTNTSCVPRLPDGSCGDLWEMLKWEKRLETQFLGPERNGWWFDGRGWGDLMEGTCLQWPVTWEELDVLQQPRYNLCGVGQPSGAPVGTYGY